MGTDRRPQLTDVQFLELRQALLHLRREPLRSLGGGKVVHRDGDGAVTGLLDGTLHQPVEGSSRRAHLLEGHHPAVEHVQHRLDREGRSQHGGRGTDPTAAPQVFEGVDEKKIRVAPAVRRAISVTASASAPLDAALAAASTAKPRPIAVDRESTTVTRCSPTWDAAIRAASQVPESSAERWMDTTRWAPASRVRR